MHSKPVLPEALRPIWISSSPNEAIRLYGGALLLHQPGKAFSVTRGTIEWNWLPNPAIRFELPTVDNLPDLAKARLEIVESELVCDVLVTSATIWMAAGSHACRGILVAPVVLGDAVEIERVVFHVPNFTRFVGDAISDSDGRRVWRGRLSLASDEWKVVIDQDFSPAELIQSLKREGGFAIAHVGSLERADGKQFAVDSASHLLTALFYFLSFARGFWCGPVLAVGQVGSENTWFQWKRPNLTPWKPVESWFPHEEGGNCAASAFGRFLEKWEDRLWGEPIKIAIHWYVESNLNAGGVEGSIVLIQAALELLGWVYLVDDHASRVCSASSFKELKASQKIRNLLSSLQIPLDIPSPLRNLVTEANRLGATDGPDVFVKLRNGIVHPSRTKRDLVLQTTPMARVEAWQLGLWYMELSLLRLLGHQGVYYRRFIDGLPGDAKACVPWASC